jgi:hypothetical protein
MTPFQTDLGDVSSWCDSACDRCPLLRECRVGQAVTRRREGLQAQDDPDVLLADLTRDLNRALVMLEEICEEEGVDCGCAEPIPTPPLVGQAQELGIDLVRAASELTEAAVRTGRIDEATSARLVGNTTLLAVKVARVAWSFSDPVLDPDRGDVVQPILLLVERASAEVRRDGRALAPFVPALLTARFAAAHGAMVDLVTPWIARVDPAARRELQARIAAGCAPSPFCRRGAEGAARA